MFEDSIKILKKNALCSDIINKHGAALIKNSLILTTGYNKFITSNKNNGNLSTIHAEIHAISKYPKKYVKNMDLIVIRINNNNINANLKNSRPCSSCIDKLTKMGIRKVYYSNCFGEIVCEFVKNMEKIHESSGTRMRKRLIKQN
jgi:deoxycytidylate deaminase